MTAALTLLTRVAYQDTEIASPQLRHLLALLARDLRTGVSAARLIDGLWPDARPANPTKALQVLVSRARSQLGHDTIVSTPTGYRLALDSTDVDLSAAERCATAALRAAHDHDDEAARLHAEAGLALWEGGSPGGDGADGPLSQVRDEAGSAYAALRRAHAIALSRLGDHDAALPTLTALAAERPQDEELLAALLRTEAATTGPAAALERYETYRRGLRDRLGTDPGPALTEAHQDLLQHDRPAVRVGVPHEPNALLGRDADIAQVARLVRTSRVTSIVGPGGLGKTRLANVVSRHADQRVVHLVPLAGVTSDDGVLPEVASALGVRDPRLRATSQRMSAARDVMTGIVDALGPTPSLLVLDNCEHVIEGAAEVARSLVALTPDLRILTTSRSPLGLSSEAVYLLPELDQQTSVALFTERARAARPDVDLPTDVVARLCRHLDGLPLAVELAAARTRVMSVTAIERRLTDRFALLRSGARDAPERHRTLQAVIDWSWNLLDREHQHALATLAVFPDGFTLEAAEHVLGPDYDTLAVLEQLLDQSLLKVVDSVRGTRFRMLETVREFGSARLAEDGLTTAVQDAFLRWSRDFGSRQSGAFAGRDQIAAATTVRTEQDNLVKALDLAVERADAGTAASVFATLAGLWTVESNHNRVIAFAPDVLWLLSHDHPAPDEVQVRREALVLGTANTLMLANHTASRGVVALRRLPPPEPGTFHGAATTLLLRLPEILQPRSPLLEELTRDPDPMLAGAAQSFASQIWENEGRVDEAVALARHSLETGSQDHNPWMTASHHARLAELFAHVGDHEAAMRHAHKALPVLEALQAGSDVTQLRWLLAFAALQLGDVDGAQRWYEEGGPTSADDPHGFGWRSAVWAEICLAKGDVEAGLHGWRRAADQVGSATNAYFTTDPPGLEPWTLATESVAVIAHAGADRLDDVTALVTRLHDKLGGLFAGAGRTQHATYLDYPVSGLGLLALGLAHLVSRDDVVYGVRLIVLAQQFRYPKMQPSVTRTDVLALAHDAGGPAYDDAVSSYAGLGPEEAVAAARALVQTCRR
ncbi:ATP-binding protein [Luteipulveratus halotolerans]|uniref:Bacterial transcriptional activator domain-containing protein n=1 Tax=Luteipulveratus halotolerans TaxID=1631356 RepID=A0A0L6CGH1_9MICO|nr:BTAD domain-containing putative transcriptional regulator [Luteipulveratus halotolerans]KNX36680.1 hypothetical protein VV01_05165 [Luteipulveratus halotolerans]